MKNYNMIQLDCPKHILKNKEELQHTVLWRTVTRIWGHKKINTSDLSGLGTVRVWQTGSRLVFGEWSGILAVHGPDSAGPKRSGLHH